MVGGALIFTGSRIHPDRMGVALACPVDRMAHLLQALDIYERFDWVVGGGNGYPLKPAPEILLAMVDRLGGGAEEPPCQVGLAAGQAVPQRGRFQRGLGDAHHVVIGRDAV